MSEKYTFHEPMPDCVPEYYRSRREDEDHRYELLMQAQAHYLANREKINAAVASRLPILSYGGYGPCWDCQAADHDTMTGADDDFERVICPDPACPQHRNHQSEEGSQ